MDRNPRGVSELVDYQIHRWEMEQARRKKEIEEAHIWPLITISREYGSLGAKLAAMLAQHLEWTCWDQEIVHELAQHSDAPETLFASLDEQRRDTISSLIDSLLYGNEVTERVYLRQLMHVVHTISHHGKAVVVGRGAHYILNGQEALRVRVVAPLSHRIQGLTERKGIDEAEAREEIVRVDAQRADFMQYHYDRDIKDAHGFDLVINVENLSAESAVKLIINAYNARFGQNPVPGAHG